MQNAPPASTCPYSTLRSRNGQHAAASPANMKPRRTPFPGGINGPDSTRRLPLQTRPRFTAPAALEPPEDMRPMEVPLEDWGDAIILTGL